MAKGSRTQARNGAARLDRALISLFIGAMDANGHVSREELGRAQHLIGSTRRFRRKSGETLGRLIDEARTAYEDGDPGEVVAAAARALPAARATSTFAVIADLLLADGTLDAPERRFLQQLGRDLRLATEDVRRIVDVILLKNQL